MLKLRKAPAPYELHTQAHDALLDTQPLAAMADTKALNVLSRDSIAAPVVAFVNEDELRRFCQDEVEERNQRNDQMPRERTYAERVSAGHVALSVAIQAERESGLTDEVTSLYHTAHKQFLGAIGNLHLPEDLRGVSFPDDAPGVFFSYAFCVEKQSQAPNVVPYVDPGSRKFDRRKDYSLIAEVTYERAEQMMALMGQSALGPENIAANLVPGLPGQR